MIPLIALAVIGLSPRPSGIHTVLKFSVAGGEVGSNTYDEAPDGSFKSHSELKIGPTRIVSDLNGSLKDGVPESWSLIQTAQNQSVSVVLKQGKVTVESGNKHEVIPFKYKGKLFFSNFHPQFLRGLSDVYRSDLGGKQNLSIYVIDDATIHEIPAITIPTRTGFRGKTQETANGFELSFPGVAFDVYTVGDKRVVAQEAKSQQFQVVDAEVTGLFVDPIAAYPELSQATLRTKSVEGVRVQMRDGVTLVHDALMPEGSGPFPVILSRTPYGRVGQVLTGAFFAKRGYVFIAQDTRGREDSDGEWDPMRNERKDGYDTIEWIAKQPWCNGNVGMIGGSYGGYVQWAAAVEHPSALKCIIPQVSPPDAFLNIPFEYGTMPMLADMWWLNIVRDKRTNMTGAGTLVKNPKGLLTLPLSKVPKAAFGYDLPMFTKWLQRDRAAMWTGFDIEKDVTSVKIPVLHVSGWWDGDGIGTELHWMKLRASGKTNQWLIEGPWTHAFNTTTKFGEYDFGSIAIRDLDSVYLRWFDTWLKGKSVGLGKMPKASLFMTGENRWHESADFPEPSAVPAKWFLSQGGALGAGSGKGSTRYTYDPHKAKVPNLPKPFSTDLSLKLTGIKFGVDQLLFKSEPLVADTSFEGPLAFKAFVRTDVVDTDLYVSLVDIFPDGTQMATVQGGKLRLAYRNGFAKPELMKPGKVYAVTVRPWWWAHRFPKGHRIAITVKSSAFPGTARNLNRGEPIATATRIAVAHIEILHDKAHPSSLSWYRLPN